MSEKYIDLMEKVLSAYTEKHILNYFNDVKTNGLKEHGFPRLTANMGILISHGRRHDLLPLFLEMMDFCCDAIPRVKAANDFSVREIICCIEEVEKSKAVNCERVNLWKRGISKIVPETCYNVFATSEDSPVRNWALFTGVSEYYRKSMGLGGDMEFIETQIASQLQWLDENGMYMDNAEEINHQPIVYDLVPRGLFMMLLNRGYNGRYFNEIDTCLKKTALFTLKMQSPNGEIAFGGRSNQFLHNESWLATIFEFEAKRYAKLGDMETAAIFKNAVARALAVMEEWLEKSPIRHIKNRFNAYTSYDSSAGFGCENYAYFDKYMITAASFLYSAYSVCDDSIEAESTPDIKPSCFKTSDNFHKLFLKSGGYGIELDYDADPHYDASGIGRIHRAGTPSTICISCPCPSHPIYEIGKTEQTPLSVCPAVYSNGKWYSGAEVFHEVKMYRENKSSAYARLICYLGGKKVVWSCSVSKKGVEIKVKGEGKIALLLPAFAFDGEKETIIKEKDNRLEISYNGYVCRYTALDGNITDMGIVANNRNGHYHTFAAEGENLITVKVSITK